MAIEIRKRPFYYCFTGNPVHYELFSSLAFGSNEVYIEVRVVFDGVATEGFPYSPVAGISEIDIQDILEGLLQPELPRFTGPETTVWPATRQTGFFYIEYREITPLNADPSWDGAEADYKLLAIYGGVSRFKYQGNNFFTNYFDADVPRAPRPFFTWQKSGRLASLQERLYLAYLLIDDVEPNNLDVVARVTYTDNSVVEYADHIPVLKNKIYFLPAGAAQWNFSTVKDIWYWDIFVKDQTVGNAAVLSTVFRYYADNRKDYNDITLHYRNSLGGLDSVRLRGVIEYNLDYEYQELQQIQRPDYYDGHFYDPQKAVTNNKELQTLRGTVGHLGKEEQDRLRDAFLKRESWWAIDKKWVPVNIITKNIKQRTTGDSRWSLPLDFTLAHDGNSFYTPDTVDLGVGDYKANVCLASLGNIAVAVAAGPSGFKTCTVSFTEIDPDNASTQIKWRVIKQTDLSEVLPWVTINFISPLVFDVPTNEQYAFEGRAICANTVLGKKTAIGIDTTTNNAGTGTSRIVNRLSEGTAFTLKRNGAAILVDKFIGANADYPFTTAAGNNVVFVFEAPLFSPAMPTISNGVSTLNGAVHNPGGLTVYITFPPINITTGVVIILG